MVVGALMCEIDWQSTTGRSPPKADITSGLTMRHAASDAGSARHRLGRAYLSLAHHQASARTGDAQRSRTSAMIDPGDQSNGALLEQYRRAGARPSHRRFASGKVRRSGHWPGRPSDDRAKKSAKGKKSMNRDKKRSLNPAKRIINCENKFTSSPSSQRDAPSQMKRISSFDLKSRLFDAYCT